MIQSMDPLSVEEKVSEPRRLYAGMVGDIADYRERCLSVLAWNAFRLADHKNMNGPALRVELWDEERFSLGQIEWDQLLERSRADPLFMSWDWQWLWWRHHTYALDASLFLIAVYDADCLVGLAPFYSRRASHRLGIYATRLETIGSSFRNDTGVFSEYLDLIVDTDRVDEVLIALTQYLFADRRWGDLVIANTKANGIAALWVRGHLGRRCYVREVDGLEAHATQLSDDFAVYLKSLTGSTRRKLWNHRSKLSGPELVFADEQDIAAFLDRIDTFHRQRWGHAHYTDVRRHFHMDMAAAMVKRDALRMSELRVNGDTISVMYNFRMGATEYNLQCGFDAAKIAGVSPGYLHFGYCFERACAEGVRTFDFLAGEGRNRQYKQDFLTTECSILTFHAVRSPLLARMYRLYATFKHFLADHDAAMADSTDSPPHPST